MYIHEGFLEQSHPTTIQLRGWDLGVSVIGHVGQLIQNARNIHQENWKAWVLNGYFPPIDKLESWNISEKNIPKCSMVLDYLPTFTI